jgi:outer membrane cobalamin receptor
MAYTYLDAENRSPDAETSELQNRPEHKLSLRVDYDLATGTRLYGAYMYVAGAVALSRNTPVTTTEVGDYNVFDLGVSQSLWNDRVRLIGRVENLLDEDYQESFGFPQPGRRFYIGAEFRL